MISLVKKPLVGKFTINESYIDKSNLCGVMVTPDFFDLVPSDILAVNVTGREWWDKTYGNSYNDFNIEFSLTNGRKSQCIYGVFEYGYGDYYMQRARCALKLLGVYDVNLPLFNHKQTGCKKRDLLTFKDVEKWGCKSLLKLAEESVK